MSLRQYFDQHFSFPKNRYRRTNVFRGRKGPINCLTFLDHRILLSGGDDHAVNIYDLYQMRLVQSLNDRDGIWGQITCIVRVNTTDGPQGFIIGTGRGRLISFRRLVHHGNEFAEMDCQKPFTEPGDYVEVLVYDPNTNCIAASSQQGYLALYEVGPDGTISKKWHIGNAGGQEQVIRGMHFHEQGTRLITYSMENGRIYTRDTATGVETSPDGVRRSLQNFVSSLDFFPDNQTLVVDNLTSGFDLYSLNRSSPNKKFDTKRAEPALIVNVKFAENGSVVIGGSDHGAIYIFNAGTGERAQVLYQESPSSPIQAIATCTTPDGDHIIASGSSCGSSTLCIWQKPRNITSIASQPPVQHPISFIWVLNQLYRTAILVLALATVWTLTFPESPQAGTLISQLTKRLYATWVPAITPANAEGGDEWTRQLASLNSAQRDAMIKVLNMKTVDQEKEEDTVVVE